MRAKIVVPSIATSLLLSLCVSAHATSVTVVSSHGSVNITQADHVVRVSDSGQLTLPAQIKTGADGAIDLKDRESQIHIGPNSTVALPDTAPSGGLVDHYLQSAGSALYNIQGRHGRPMSVETPYLVSVVKGTVFTISVEDGAARVTLMEGSLEVSAPGVNQHVLLKANQSIRHGAGESSLVISPVGTAPEIIKGNSAQLQTSGGEETRGAQMAMVTRDLAEVGATVTTQHVLTAAAAARNAGPPAGTGGSPPPSNGGAGAAPGSGSTAGSTTAATGSTGSSPSGNPGSSGSGTEVTTTSNGGGSTPTSGSGSSGSTGSSGNPSGPGSSTGTGSNPSSGTGSSGSTGTSGSGSNGNSGSSSNSGTSESSGNGSSGSDTSGSGTTNIGCNGKNNGTGMGQCKGHRKQ